jgi:hypothetical protein
MIKLLRENYFEQLCDEITRDFGDGTPLRQSEEARQMLWGSVDEPDAWTGEQLLSGRPVVATNRAELERIVSNAPEKVGVRRSVERKPPNEELEEHHAQCPNVNL